MVMVPWPSRCVEVYKLKGRGVGSCQGKDSRYALSLCMLQLPLTPHCPYALSVPSLPPLPHRFSSSSPSPLLFPLSLLSQSCHGKYLSAQPDGRAEWNRDAIGPWERFRVTTVAPGTVTLLSCHGKYASAQRNGSLDINRDAAPPGGWEMFTWQDV
jgi:hypothetical protein